MAMAPILEDEAPPSQRLLGQCIDDPYVEYSFSFEIVADQWSILLGTFLQLFR